MNTDSDSDVDSKHESIVAESILDTPPESPAMQPQYPDIQPPSCSPQEPTVPVLAVQAAPPIEVPVPQVPPSPVPAAVLNRFKRGGRKRDASAADVPDVKGEHADTSGTPVQPTQPTNHVPAADLMATVVQTTTCTVQDLQHEANAVTQAECQPMAEIPKPSTKSKRRNRTVDPAFQF